MTEMLFGFDIVLFQKGNDADVVHECYNVGPWESFKRWHVSVRGLNRTKDVFGEADGIELKVRLEEETGCVIDSPFARLLERGSVIFNQYSLYVQLFTFTIHGPRFTCPSNKD